MLTGQCPLPYTLGCLNHHLPLAHNVPYYKNNHRLIYKAKGPSAPTNLPLDEATRAALDAITLEQLLASFRRDGASFSKGSSSYRGVSWDKTNKYWQAFIRVQGKNQRLYLGPCEEDAARAYDAAALRTFGPRWVPDACAQEIVHEPVSMCYAR